MTKWKSDCIHFNVDHDSDDWGKYIAPPIPYCEKDYTNCENCEDYEKR